MAGGPAGDDTAVGDWDSGATNSVGSDGSSLQIVLEMNGNMS